MGQALPKPALRPFLIEDTPVLAAIFIAAIEELTGDDYNEAQQEAWASAAADEEQFGERLASELTLIAMLQNSPVGFAQGQGSHRHALCASQRGGAGRRLDAVRRA
jgi:putative acetyltransferase